MKKKLKDKVNKRALELFVLESVIKDNPRYKDLHYHLWEFFPPYESFPMGVDQCEKILEHWLRVTNFFVDQMESITLPLPQDEDVP